MSPGVRYILVATVFFTLMNVGVKALTRIPSHEIVFFRAVVMLVVAYALVRRHGLSPWGNNKRLLLARGLSGTVALVLYFYTVQQMPLSSAVTVQYLSPLFTIMFAAALVHERARAAQWPFFIIAFAGVALIKGFDARVSGLELTAGVTSALFSGLAYNFVRMLKDHDHPWVVVFYFPLVTVPIVGVYTAFHWVTPHGWEWAVLLFIGLCTTAFQINMTKAYHADRAANVSVFNYLGTPLAIGLGYLMFDEAIGLLAAIGFGLIIFGVVMSTRYSTTRGVKTGR